MIKRVRVIWMCMVGFVIMFAVIGCDGPSLDNSPVSNFRGGGFEQIISVSCSGGLATVEFVKYVPLILASDNEECRIGYGTCGKTPETFEFSSSDIVNLITDFLEQDCIFTTPSEAMLRGGATILENSDKIDYGWMKAEITRERVKIEVLPNETGVDRRVFLVFYPEFWWFDDVITVCQSAG